VEKRFVNYEILRCRFVNEWLLWLWKDPVGL